MRILIDINHPAHVHYFRNFYEIMTSRGHEILVISRNKEIEHALLTHYRIPFIDRGRGRTGRLSKFIYLIYADLKILWQALRFRPDVFLSFLHPYPAHVAFLLRRFSIAFSDTEHARLHHQLTVPFATRIYTPDCYRIDLGAKHRRFRSFMEMCYLHPDYFTPDSSVLEEIGVKPGEVFIIIRFVSWAAAHDFGHSGFSLANKRRLISRISSFGKVFISAEGELPEDMEQLRIRIAPHRMHHALCYATLLFGESATMASEAAMLGTPSVFLDNDGRGYTDYLEKRYGIVSNFTESERDQEHAILRAVEILEAASNGKDHREIRSLIVSDSINTTAFMVDEVEQLALNGKTLVAG